MSAHHHITQTCVLMITLCLWCTCRLACRFPVVCLSCSVTQKFCGFWQGAFERSPLLLRAGRHQWAEQSTRPHHWTGARLSSRSGWSTHTRAQKWGIRCFCWTSYTHETSLKLKHLKSLKGVVHTNLNKLIVRPSNMYESNPPLMLNIKG